MQLNDTMISLIRTWVPIAVGAVIAWLTTSGLDIDAETQTSLVIGITGLIQAAYYAVVRVLENTFPQAGWLLGKAKVPNYTPIEELAAQAYAQAKKDLAKKDTK